MTNSRKRDTITECSGAYKRRDTGKGKETVGSDSDLDLIFDVQDMSTLANEFRYYNSQAKALGEDVVGVKLLLERPIDEASFTNRGMKQLLWDRRLLGTIKLSSKPQCLLFENTVVPEFYANLETSAGDDDSAGYCKVYIRRAMFDFSPTKLNEILGTRNLGRLPTRIGNELLAKELTGVKLLEWPVIGLRRCHLTRMYAVLHEIGWSNCFPTNYSDDVSVDQDVLLYSVGRSPRSIVENQLNVIYGEVSNFQAQVRSFFDIVPVQEYKVHFTGKFNNHIPGAIRVSRELLQCNAKVDDLTKLATSHTTTTGERGCIMVRDFIREYLNKQLELKHGEVATLDAQIKALSIGGPTELPHSSPDNAKDE